MKQTYLLGLITLLLLALSACQTSADENTLSGTAILWYPAGVNEERAIGTILKQFADINPAVRIVAVPIEEDELAQRFRDTVEQGLGPDMVVGLNSYIGEWADTGLIRPVLTDTVNLTLFSDTVVHSAEYQNQLYGVPLALRPQALLINHPVETTPLPPPPSTLDALLQQTDAGELALLNANFWSAYWGIKSFGGNALLDADGRVTFSADAIRAWLGWLKQTQDNPNLIISRDDIALRNLFLEGDSTYYIADYEFLPDALSVLTDTLQIAALPVGTVSRSGSPLIMETLLFNAESSDTQIAITNALARFFVTAEPQAVLLRLTARVPANRLVRIDSRIYPAIAALQTQAQAATPYPNGLPFAEIEAIGNFMIANVLSDVSTVDEAVCQFGESVKFLLEAQFNQTGWQHCQWLEGS